jgi:competence protein ComGC
VEEKIMEKFIITAFIVCIIISTVLLLFVIVSVSKNKTKQERELEDREQEEFMSSLRKTE